MDVTDFEYRNLPYSIDVEKLPRAIARAIEIARLRRYQKERYEYDLATTSRFADDWMPAMPKIAIAMIVGSAIAYVLGFAWVLDAGIMRLALGAVFAWSVSWTTLVRWETNEFSKRDAVVFFGVVAIVVSFLLQAAAWPVVIAMYAVTLLLCAWRAQPRSSLRPADRDAAREAIRWFRNDNRVKTSLVLGEAIESLKLRAEIVRRMRNRRDAGRDVPELVEEEYQLSELFHELVHEIDYLGRALKEGEFGSVDISSPEALQALERVESIRNRIREVHVDAAERLAAQAEVAKLGSPS